MPGNLDFVEKSDWPSPYPDSTICNAPVAGALDGTLLSFNPAKSSERLLDDEPGAAPTLRAMVKLDAKLLLGRTIVAVSESQEVDSPALTPNRILSVAEKVPRFDPHRSMGDGIVAACTLLLATLLISGGSKLNTSESDEVA